jgi:hypothetical protein
MCAVNNPSDLMHDPDYNDGYENEPPYIWIPKIGDKARIVGDWSMGHLQVGYVVAIETGESDSEYWQSFTVRLDDGSQDAYELSDLVDPDIELDMDFDYCQDCGDLISFADGTAYVTESGDVYCRECGRQADEDQWDADAEDSPWDFYPEPWYDPTSPISELEPPETPTHRFIGNVGEVEDDKP